MKAYPRFITPKFAPFDPVELARQTEKIVTRGPNGLERNYTRFYKVGVYGGIATGYAVGCCLRCFYCWSGFSRDFPEKYGKFYSPEQAFKKLDEAAKKGRVYKLRVSGCEPTIGKNHLLALLELVEDSEYPLFILETNGILFGTDRDYVEKVSKFTKVHVRLCIKAGNAEGFQRRTGAIGKFYTMPFDAVKNLFDSEVSFHVASMSDSRIMSAGEREQLIKKLEEIDKNIVRNLEEEVVDPYRTTLFRLKQAGIKLKW